MPRLHEADVSGTILSLGLGYEHLMLPMEVEKQVKNTASQDGQSVTIRMPEDPSAAGKADTAKDVKLLTGYCVKVVRPTGDKTTRPRRHRPKLRQAT